MWTALPLGAFSIVTSFIADPTEASFSVSLPLASLIWAITGVVIVGEPDSTTLVVPVEVVTPVPPLATGKVPVTPVVSGRPVAEVKTSAVGVPSAGVISVGEVENTKLVEVVPVAPAAVKPDILLNAAIPALVAFVPPNATVTGAVSENTVPVSVSPVDAV
jgi:hypothetical protein